MSPRASLLLLQLLGGPAVLGSYAWGGLTHPGAGAALWGGVPEALRPLYTLSMLTATLGYLVSAPYVLFRLQPDEVRVGARGFGLFSLLYALVLFPSAMWMPLTFEWVASPSPGLYALICAVLATVGGASVALIWAIARAAPVPSPRGRALALVGASAFALQTALLDGIVWPILFPRTGG
jgi:hypothetical protein